MDRHDTGGSDELTPASGSVDPAQLAAWRALWRLLLSPPTSQEEAADRGQDGSAASEEARVVSTDTSSTEL